MMLYQTLTFASPESSDLNVLLETFTQLVDSKKTFCPKDT